MAGKSKAQKEAEALQAKAIELSGLSAEDFAALSDHERAGFAAKAQEAAGAASGQAQEVDNSHLVEVHKDGAVLHVHPSCLADHKRLGWTEV